MQIPSPLVSVIIPVYNGASFLRQALESVWAQTFNDYETIVIDDASTDDTPDIIRAYGDRIHARYRKENSKTADIPRYEGVEQSTGMFCAFLDADDLWTPTKLEKQVAFMRSHPDIPLSHTYVGVIDEKGREMYVRHLNAIPSTGRIGAKLVEHCFISTSSVMVKKDAWLTAQKKTALTEYGTEWDFFLALARDHEIGFLPEVLSKYRILPDSVSRKRWRRTPRDIGAKERIFRKGLWAGLVSRSAMRRIISDAALEGSQYWRDKCFRARSGWFALKAIQYTPLEKTAWLSLAKSIVKI